MRYLLTLLFAALSLNAFSQNNSIHVYPWNPDADQDNQIGSGDLLPFLSVFGNEFGLPPEPCNYDGTTIEDFFIGIHSGEVVLDSIYIEYKLEDVSSYYIEGCPDEVTDTIVFVWNNMDTSPYLWNYADYFRFSCGQFHIYYYHTPQTGQYSISYTNYLLNDLGFTGDGFFGDYNASSGNTFLPWPDSWVYDENGISIEIPPSINDPWTDYASYLHILPYWHYADE